MKLFVPWRRYKSLAEVSIGELSAQQVETVLLDMDNTLVPWHTQDVSDGAKNWLAEAKAAGMTLLLFSNNNAARLAPLSAQLGVEYIHHACKPYGRGLRVLRQRLGSYKAEHCVLIGDQYFTDILCGNLHGIKTVLVEPLSTNENIWTKCMRRLERCCFGRGGKESGAK